MKEGLVVLGTLVGIVIAFTVLAGGQISLGTSQSGPFLSAGFKGPQYRG